MMADAAPPRVWGIPRARLPQVAAAIIVASFVVRLGWTFAIPDYATMQAPDSGPDSLTYTGVGWLMHTRGLLAPNLVVIPFWPAGYPTFIALVYGWLGLHLLAPIVVQQLLLSVSFVSVYRLATREFSEEVGLLALALVAISPALNLSATLFMYEPLLAACAAAAADLISSAAQHRERRQAVRAIIGMLLAGFGATLQPKLLLVGLGFAAWLAWRVRHLALVSICVVALCLGPLTLATRNYLADGKPVLSANLGFTMLMGLNDHARGGYVKDTVVAQVCGGRSVDTDPALDPVWRSCALRWAAAHPVRAAILGPAKAIHFWMPMVGSYAQYGTWRHALDPQRGVIRLFPGVAHAARGTSYLIGALWMALTLFLVARGAYLGWRTNRPGTILILLPVMAFLLITMVTVGDARFRLPVAPFYTILMAITLQDLSQRVIRRPRSLAGVTALISPGDRVPSAPSAR